jgi:hypothetical protein
VLGYATIENTITNKSKFNIFFIFCSLPRTSLLADLKPVK